MFLFPDSQPGLHNFSSKGVDWVSFLLGNPLLASSIARHFFLSRRLFFISFRRFNSVSFVPAATRAKELSGRPLLAKGNHHARSCSFQNGSGRPVSGRLGLVSNPDRFSAVTDGSLDRPGFRLRINCICVSSFSQLASGSVILSFQGHIVQ